MSDLISAFCYAVHKHINKQKINLSIFVENQYGTFLFLTYPEVSHRSGRCDMVIIAFFGLVLLHFFSSLVLAKHCY